MSEKEQLNELDDCELVAYWNILNTLCVRGSADKQERHLELVDQLLTERGVPHERGLRTVNVVAA